MPQPAPTVIQAFTLDSYFNSTSTDPVEAPVAKGGLSVPAGWGLGLKAWRRDWRAWVPGQGPNNPYWNPGLRKLVIGRTYQRNDSYYPAQSNPFTLNAWDLEGPSANPSTSTVTNAQIQVSAYYLNANNQAQYVCPPFVSYCWGIYSANATQIPFPTTLPTGQNYVQINQADANPAITITLGGVNNPLGGGSYQVGPATTQKMNVGALITFMFLGSITAPAYGTLLRMQVAVYLTLTPSWGPSSVQCFDDPEIDVDCSG